MSTKDLEMTKIENVRWFVTSLVICCSGITVGKMLFDMTPPGNMYLPSGSDLELNCSTTNASLDANLIHIDIKYDYNGTCNIPDCDMVQFQRVSNETGFRALTMRIPHVAVRDGATYYCFYGDPPSWESFKRVNVADLPPIPDNLSCISHNFENLQCCAAFELLSTYIPLSWTLSYHLNRTTLDANCSYIEANSTIVCPPVNITEDYYNYTVNITLIGKNIDYNATITKTTTVLYDYAIVKPNGVENVRIHNTNGSNVIVFWDLWLFASNLDLVQRLELVSLNNWTKPQSLDISLLNSSLAKGTASFSHHFSNLIPNGQYTVSIRWKPAIAHGENYWSTPTSIIFVTNIDVPGLSVSMTNGSFYFTTSNTSESTLLLYWRNPDDRSSHGIITKYRVEVRKHAVSSEQVIRENDDDNETQPENVKEDTCFSEEIIGMTNAAFINNTLNRSFAYTVKVWAGNRAGYCSEPTEIRIPSLNIAKQLRPSWVVVERDIGRARAFISWDQKEIHRHNLARTVVYSCQDEEEKADYIQCKNFSWESVGINDTRLRLNMSREHIFAVSIETEFGLSGGIVWQTQSFIYGRVPDIPTYSVISDPFNNTVLTVTVIYGGSSGGRPVLYSIYVTETTGNRAACQKGTPPIEHAVDFSKSDILLTGLKPGTEFVVCLSSRNIIGESLFGNPTIGKTSSNIVTLDEIDNSWAIGLGICLTLLLLSIAVCVVVFRVKQMISKSQLENGIETINVTVDQYPDEQTGDKLSSAQLQLLDMANAEGDIHHNDSGAESGEAPIPEPQHVHGGELEQPLIEDQEPPEEMADSNQWSVFSESSAGPFESEHSSSETGIVGYQQTYGCSSGLTANSNMQDIITSDNSKSCGSDVHSLLIERNSDFGDFT